MRKCIRNSLFLVALISYLTQAQDIPYGSWRNHFSFRSAQILTLGEGKVFCASKNGLFYYDIGEGFTRKISKLDGLSDVGVTAMSYNASLNMLVVGYHTGAIDLVLQDEVVNISAVKRIPGLGAKTIRDITFVGNQAFLATDIGVVLLDLEGAEARDIFNEIGMDGQSVQATKITFLMDSLFVLTDQGILSGNIEDNLLDFNNWNLIVDADTSQISDLEIYNDSLYAVVSDSTLMSYSTGHWKLCKTYEKPIRSISSQQGILFVLFPNSLLQISNGLEETSAFGIFGNGQEVVMVDNGLFIADLDSGLIMFDNSVSETEFLSPGGPINDYPSKITLAGDRVYLTYGSPGIDPSRGRTNAFDVFADNLWENKMVADLMNVSDISIFNNQLFISDFEKGLYDQTDQVFVGFFLNENVVDLEVFDNSLWALSSDRGDVFVSPEAFSWTGLNATLEGPHLFTISIGGTLIIDQQTAGLVAFNPDRNASRSITVSQGLPVNNLNDFIVDRNDELWVATDVGLAFFFNATNTTDTDEEAITPLFDAGTLTSTNFNFTALEIDGGNRRWFGTDKGLWLFDDNLTEQFAHFTSANSPLPSDHILKLKINTQTGELFVSTDRGVVSYQSTSSEPQRNHRSVTFIPNPVSLMKNESITISGVTGNGSIKITNIEGSIITEITAYGSTANWDLRTFTGETVSPGVYLIFSTDTSGEDTFVGKFAVMP